MSADLVGRQVADIGFPVLDQLQGPITELLKIIRSKILVLAPIKPEPVQVALDRFDVLDLFLGRVGIVKPQVTTTAELAGDPEVETDGLGVADVQVAVRLRREAGHELSVPLAGGAVGADDLADKIEFGRLAGFLVVAHQAVMFTRPTGKGQEGATAQRWREDRILPAGEPRLPLGFEGGLAGSERLEQQLPRLGILD